VNKQELVKAIADSAEITQKQADLALKALVDAIKSTLGSDQEIAIPELGKFSVTVRAARDGKNPLTGAALHIPERKVPKFSPAKALKDHVAG
jgi:DNA-binding protein HU-beta